MPQQCVTSTKKYGLFRTLLLSCNVVSWVKWAADWGQCGRFKLQMHKGTAMSELRVIFQWSASENIDVSKNNQKTNKKNISEVTFLTVLLRNVSVNDWEWTELFLNRTTEAVKNSLQVPVCNFITALVFHLRLYQ